MTNNAVDNNNQAEYFCSIEITKRWSMHEQISINQKGKFTSGTTAGTLIIYFIIEKNYLM